MNIEVINGPNLNLLGRRQPEIYGTDTLEDIERMVLEDLAGESVSIAFRQSNGEGEIIDLLHSARYERGAEGVVLNPGAYTHYSLAIRDAVASIEIPVIEVHLSNIHAREAFRQVSLVAGVCKGRIEGLGWRGYLLAIRYLMSLGRA